VLGLAFIGLLVLSAALERSSHVERSDDSPGIERLAAIVLALTVQICATAPQHGAAAQDAPKETGTEKIVVTIEVTDKLRAARAQEPGHFGADWKVPAPLPQASDSPIVTVDVDPPDPNDFVVTINGTAYQAGARLFRLVAGLATITVSRRGNKSCEAKLDVTATGPNAVACRF
jgi:hypothetical protein